MPGKLLNLLAPLFTALAAAVIPLQAQGRDFAASDNKNAAVDTDSKSTTKAEKTSLKRITPTERSPRVLFITKTGCERCKEQLDRLRKPGGEFDTMTGLGWKIGDGPDNHIQIVDADDVPEMVKLLQVHEYPTVACVVDGEIVRSFKDGCTTPLDAWTFGWLIKGKSERPAASIPEAARVASTGHYRLRGNHWTVEGDPNPPKQAVLNHIRGPNHGHAIASYGAIDQWSYEELRSLHDDLHETEGGTIGNVAAAPQYYGTAPANVSLDAFSGNRKVTGR